MTWKGRTGQRNIHANVWVETGEDAAAALSEKTQILWAPNEKKITAGGFIWKVIESVIQQKCFGEKCKRRRLTQSVKKQFLSM